MGGPDLPDCRSMWLQDKTLEVTEETRKNMKQKSFLSCSYRQAWWMLTINFLQGELALLCPNHHSVLGSYLTLSTVIKHQINFVAWRFHGQYHFYKRRWAKNAIYCWFALNKQSKLDQLYTKYRCLQLFNFTQSKIDIASSVGMISADI